MVLYGKNGHLKHLFHGKSDIIQQLIFNVDVSHTLQQVCMRLVEHESKQTMAYIERLAYHTPRSNMTYIGDHVYAIGQFRMATPTVEQSALGLTCTIPTFSIMLKDNIVYHSTGYAHCVDGKRNSTYCCYQAGSSIDFGQIEIFTMSPIPQALVRKIIPLNPLLINKAGPPCRQRLAPYRQIDLLSNYIIPVSLPRDLAGVPFDCIIGKPVVVTAFDNSYCILQPNNVEHN